MTRPSHPAPAAPLTAPHPPHTAAAPSVQAFETLYRAEVAWARRTLQRLGAASADLDDLTHDVFIAAYRAFERYDPSRPPRPWLFGIAYRILSADRRKARHRVEVPERSEEEAAAQPSPESDYLNAEVRGPLMQALDALPFAQRAVFVAIEIDETPAPELAVAIGVSVNTVYSRLRLARERMVKSLRTAGIRGV